MTSLIPRPSTNGTRRSSGGSSQPGLVAAAPPGLSSFPSRTASVRSAQNNGSGMAGQGHLQQIRHGRGPSTDSRRSQQQFPNFSAPIMADRDRPRRKVKRLLRPQYPLDSEERHVEYILVASFDIDKGPTMEHQYPAPISDNEEMLAELMMPDQTHTRSEDWTIFFLHKDSGEQEEHRKAEQEQRRRRKEERRLARAERLAQYAGEDGAEPELSEDDETSEEESEDEGGEGPPLIYVLNLVNTKMLDNPTTNRGSLVKSMAICTRHPFLHIYKPLLLLALQDYFKTPEVDTLRSLYDAVNAMDLSLLPKFTTFERRLLLSTDKKNLFTEKFERMVQQAHADDQSGEPNMLAKSPARPMIPRDTRDFESRVVYNSIPIPIKVPSAISPETVGDFSIIKLIQTFSIPHATQPQPFALHPHLTSNGAYTHPILVLVNAVLTQKRVIFLGHLRPSGEVAEAVLAACALCSGTILRGFTRHAFPYTDLSKIDDLLNVPGFIAGVTNSIFADHLEWWDVLCDLSTGRMKISTKIEPAIPTEGLANFQQQHSQFAPNNTGVLPTAPSSDVKGADPTGDVLFMEDILRSMAARHGEHAIRIKWHQYVTRFLRLASAFEETVFGASALDIGAAEADAATLGVAGHGCVWPDDTTRIRELAAFAWRIEGWRNTRSYYALVQDIAVTWSRQPVRQLDLAHQIDRLRLLKLPRDESAGIFLALRDAIKSYAEICQLLAAAPESQASVFYIGLGLFHPDREVREATAELLERIRDHEVGRHYWPQLGRFSRVALMRIQRDMMEAEVDVDDDDDDDVGGTGFAVSRSGFGARPFS